MVEAAVAAGFPAAQAQFFDAAEEAGKFLADFVSAGDLLLVKGSRGVKMERIIEIIRDRHAAAPGGEA
jgi:UDP-N-acetylmuramoyl-tripeptide--D-alanyl-D-alanine ligase